MTPLQTALVEHAILHKRVADYANNPDRSLNEADLRGDGACGLGAWLTTEEIAFGDRPEYAVLAEAHTAFHRICADAVKHADASSLPEGWLGDGGQLKMAVQRLSSAIARMIFEGGDGPHREAATWRPPPYARPDSYEEREVRVGSGPALPGTLTLPRGAGPWPIVVLVHGSGPNDADESIGAAKPFKDLAWGLGSRGVAVLRYVKRTRHAPEGVKTIKEEVLDGARAAIELCRATPGVDARRIVVAGHSQGGALAPRIAADDPSVAAIVMLAAPSRTLQDLFVDQFTYFVQLDPGSAEAARRLVVAKRLKGRLDDPGLAPDDDVVMPDGATRKGGYYLSLRGYDPAQAAAQLLIPTLLLQGERDYQVTAPDLSGYERALAGKPNVTIKRYPSLNHLFIAGSGKPSPEEYRKPGHVDEQVVADIASWIDARVRP